jgi:hypothetical protein
LKEKDVRKPNEGLLKQLKLWEAKNGENKSDSK